MTLSGGYAYIAGGYGTVESCAINVDGTLTNCNTYTVAAMQSTATIAVTGSTAYVAVSSQIYNIYACSLSAGALTNCIL